MNLSRTIKPHWALGLGTLFWGIGLLYVYLKHALLIQQLGYSVLRRTLGRAAVSDLTILERLAVFRQDIFEGLILFPLAAAVIFTPLRLQHRRILAFVVGFALILLFYINLLSIGNVGRFLGSAMMLDAIKWGWLHPDDIASYVSASSATKFVVLAIGFSLFVRFAADAQNQGSRRLGKIATNAFPWLLAVTLLIAGASSVAVVPVKSFGQSALKQIYIALFSEESGMGRFERMNRPQLAAEFATLTHTPFESSTASPFFGAERGSNIILFILETGPARAFHPLRSAPDRTIDELKRRAFVSTAHYSTYPYTSDAVFSIFSGLYPLLRKPLLLEKAPSQFGWVASFKKAGYKSVAYKPDCDSSENDTKMFNMVGFPERYIACLHKPSAAIRQRTQELIDKFPNSREDPKLRQRLEARLILDVAALEQLKADVKKFNDLRQPFIAAFLPQIGHGPWFDMIGTPNVIQRGEALIRLQMQWLEELLMELRSAGALDKTVIVVTADHGVRTTQEDSAFVPTSVSDYSFEVPFLMFTPNTLSKTRIIDAPTSHIDIAPTLLALFGIRDYLWPQHGVEIWSTRLHQRSLFFFAGGYYGSDGFYHEKNFTTCSMLTEECRRNDGFKFPPNTTLPTTQAQSARNFLSEIKSLQMRLAKTLDVQ